MSCANSGFIGYPILLLTLPSVAGVVLALNMMVANLVVIPLVLLLAERGRGDGGRWHAVVGKAFVRLAANPLLIAIVAASPCPPLGWRLPAAVARTVDLFALSSSALSLFVIGGTLVALPMRGLGRKIVPIAIGKLLLASAGGGARGVRAAGAGMPRSIRRCARRPC